MQPELRIKWGQLVHWNLITSVLRIVKTNGYYVNIPEK